MNRKRLIFKFSKRCEKPDNKLFRFLNIFFVFAMVNYGRHLYKKLRKVYKEKTIVCVPSSDAGDIMFFRFSKKLLEEKYGKDWVYVYDNRNRRIVESLDFQCTCPMPVYSIAALSYANFYDNDKKIKLVNGYSWCLFDCEKKNSHIELDYPRLEPDKAYLDNIISENELDKNKAVILAPYEQGITSSGLPILSNAFWEELARKLVDKGYVVFTNCKDDEIEPKIKGTKKIFPKFCDMEACVNVIGNLISMRSGFIDYVRNSSAKMMVLYPNDEYYLQWGINLKGNNEKIKELKYLDSNLNIVSEEELLNNIVGWFNE